MAGYGRRTPVRKAAEISAEKWLKAGLPRGHGLPSPRVMAGQIVLLEERLLEVLRAQQERYARYIEEHPPWLAPVHKDAAKDLPPEAIGTYHTWLEGVATRREWFKDANLRFEIDQMELSDALRESLEEAVGTGAVSARKALGALQPGFTPLGQAEAQALLKDIKAYASGSPEAQAIYEAVSDRATQRAVRAAVLRDGAGRVVGAVSYRTVGGVLSVGHLGALEGQVPGTGVQMVRELAAIAAQEGSGVTLTVPSEAQSFFSALGFARDAEGGLRLSAEGAATLSAGTGPLPGWARVGWLEGSELTFTNYGIDEAPVESLLAEIKGWQGIVRGNREDAKAIATAAVNRALSNRAKMHPEDYGLAVLRDATGKLQAVAAYIRRKGDKAIYGEYLGVNPDAPIGTGRQLMRKLAGLASEYNQGFDVLATQQSAPFYERLGMKAKMGYHHFTAAEAAALAAGLKGNTAFAGQLTWELAVAGASEWLRAHKIRGVVDEVTATTHKALVDALAYGLEHGESTQQLAYRVRNLDNVFGPIRAERIARTEVITANRAGGYRMGKEAGCAEHEWRARVESPRTRDWHRSAHKQRVPYDQPYTVYNRKGEPQQLMYPGDTSLGAGPDNVIQCRCSERHIKPGVTDDETLGIHQYGLADGPAAPGPVVAGWVQA